MLFGVFCALFAAGFTLLFLSGGLMGSSSDLGEGLSRVFGILFSLFPSFLGIPVILGLAVCAVCMFAVKNKFPTALASLILWTFYLPALAFLLYITGTTFFARLPALFAVAAAMAVVYLAAYVLTCVYVHLCRMQRREER